MPRMYVLNRLRSQSADHFPNHQKIHRIQLKTIQFINQKFGDLKLKSKYFTNKQNIDKNKKDKKVSMLEILHQKQFCLIKHEAIVDRLADQIKDKKLRLQQIKRHRLMTLTNQSRQFEKQFKKYEHEFVQRQKLNTYWGNQIFLNSKLEKKQQFCGSDNRNTLLNSSFINLQRIKAKSQYHRQNTFILKKWSQIKLKKQNKLSQCNDERQKDSHLQQKVLIKRNYRLFQNLSKFKNCQKYNKKPKLKL